MCFSKGIPEDTSSSWRQGTRDKHTGNSWSLIWEKPVSIYRVKFLCEVL